MQIAELFARLGFNIDLRGLNNFRNELNNTGNQANSIISSMTKGFVALGATIGTVLSVGVIKDFAEGMASLEDATLAVSSTLNLNIDQYKELNKLAINVGEISSLTTKGAVEMADAFAGAGSNFSQIVDLLPTTALFRDATGKKLIEEEYAGLFARVQNVFELDANGIKVAGDSIREALNAGTLNVRDFNETFTYTANVAKQFGGLNIQELSAAIATVSTAVRGSSAGTSLTSIFTKLLNPNEAIQEELNAAGIQTKKGGAMKPLGEILEEVAKYTKGTLKQADRQAQFFQKWFGNDASTLAAATALFNNPQKYASALSQISNPTKTLEQVAAESRSPFTVAMENLSASWESLKKTIWGDSKTGQFGLQNLLIPVINKLTEAIESLEEHVIVLNSYLGKVLKPQQPKVEGRREQSNVPPLIGGLVVLSTLFNIDSVVRNISNRIMKQINLILFRVVPLVARFRVAILTLSVFVTHLDGFIDKLETASKSFARLRAYLGMLGTTIGSIIAEYFYPLLFVVGALILVIQDLYTFFTGSGQSVIGDYFAEGDETIQSLVATVKSLWDALNDISVVIGKQLGIDVKDFWDLAGKIFNKLNEWFIWFVTVGGLAMLVTLIGGLAATLNLVSIAVDNFKKAWNGLKDIYNNIILPIANVIDRMIESLDKFGWGVWDKLKGIGQNAFNLGNPSSNLPKPSSSVVNNTITVNAQSNTPNAIGRAVQGVLIPNTPMYVQ